MAAVEEIRAGNPARITSIITALDTPAGAPTAIVCVTELDGTLVGTLTETVGLVGDVVTVTADWAIPDTQAGGMYVATVDTAGTMIAARQIPFRVLARLHVDPHV